MIFIIATRLKITHPQTNTYKLFIINTNHTCQLQFYYYNLHHGSYFKLKKKDLRKLAIVEPMKSDMKIDVLREMEQKSKTYLWTYKNPTSVPKQVMNKK